MNRLEVNQRALMAEVARIRGALAKRPEHCGTTESGGAENATDAEIVKDMRSEATALDNLCTVFSLSPFERDILLLCAGVELDSAFAAACVEASGDPRKSSPTFSLALATLPKPHWSALLPAAPLRWWRLIELGAGESVTTSPLRIDERILHYLTG